MAAPLAHESYLMHEKHLSVVARFHDKAAPLLLGGNGNLRGLPTPLPPAPPRQEISPYQEMKGLYNHLPPKILGRKTPPSD